MLVEVNPMIVTPDREVKALDAKVTLDGNSLFRHPDNAELRDAGGEDPQEQMAKERGLTYVKLDGNVGILGNGAGLVMSTLDVVAQAGGKPANFLDAGGGSKAEAITQAVEVILSDEKVTAVLFNIFGGITRCDEVAKGLIEAFAQIKPTVPFVVRLDGTNDKEGRALLAEADLCAEATMLGAAKRVTRRGPTMRGRDRPPGEGTGPSSARPTRAEAGPDGDPRRQRHEALRLRHHRPRGHVPRDEQPALRHAGRVGRDARQGRPGRRGRPGVQHVPRRGRRDRRQHGDDLRAAALRRRLDPRGRGRRHRARRSRSPRASPPTTSCASTTTCSATRTAAWSARTAPASSRPARPTSGSSPRRSSRRATSASSRAPAR